MCDHEYGNAHLPGYAQKELHDFVSCLCILVSRRFIRQYKLRVDGQRAGDGLLGSVEQLVGVSTQPFDVAAVGWPAGRRFVVDYEIRARSRQIGGYFIDIPAKWLGGT